MVIFLIAILIYLFQFEHLEQLMMDRRKNLGETVDASYENQDDDGIFNNSENTVSFIKIKGKLQSKNRKASEPKIPSTEDSADNEVSGKFEKGSSAAKTR